MTIHGHMTPRFYSPLQVKETKMMLAQASGGLLPVTKNRYTLLHEDFDQKGFRGAFCPRSSQHSIRSCFKPGFVMAMRAISRVRIVHCHC